MYVFYCMTIMLAKCHVLFTAAKTESSSFPSTILKSSLYKIHQDEKSMGIRISASVLFSV